MTLTLLRITEDEIYIICIAGVNCILQQIIKNWDNKGE